MNTSDADRLNLPLIQGGQAREGWELYKRALLCWPGAVRIIPLSLFMFCAVLALHQLEASKHPPKTVIHTITIEKGN